MKFVFHPDALNEFNHAIDYYENCEPFLGYDFSLEVRSTIQNICVFPDSYFGGHAAASSPRLLEKPLEFNHKR